MAKGTFAWKYLSTVLGALLYCAVYAAYAADAPPPTAHAIVVSTTGHPLLTLDAKALAAMPHEQVTAAAHDEPASRWAGVKLQDVLARAGVPLDQPLRGKALATFVRVTAADHYQVVFGLSDLDPTLGNTQVLLVDTRDGKPLEKDGPFRLLVPGDKRPARWVRDVVAIDVVDGATAGRP